LKAVVRKSTGSWYELETAKGERLKARLKGKIRTQELKSTNPVAVGDYVEYQIEREEVIITAILPRKNYLIRRSIKLSKQVQIVAANIDQIFLMISLKAPVTFMGFVDRFLVGAEAYRIPVVLIYNKIDLLSETELLQLEEKWKPIYGKAGYTQIQLSALKRIGIQKLKEMMKDKTSIFSGHSGVGKSTLINALNPGLNLKVQPISKAHQSGKHTTTFAEMHDLKFGGKIIDTPGIKGFGNVEIEKEHLAHYFPEMRAKMNRCKFHNCIHINEPNCAVKKAVEQGEIAASRYENYLSIYEEDEKESYRQLNY